MAKSRDQDGAADTKVFISYAHQDEAIADEVERQFRALYRNRIKFFLDRKSIAPGDEWEKIIRDNLADSDLLVVIYRGIHSEYVGFEVGTFLNSRDTQISADADPRRTPFRSTDEIHPVSPGSILVFHNADVVPSLFHKLQTIRVPDTESLSYEAGSEHPWAKTRLGQYIFSISAFKNFTHRHPPMMLKA